MRYLEAVLMALWGLVFFLCVEICIWLPLYLLGIPGSWLASRFARIVVVPSLMDPERPVFAYANPILNWWLGNKEDGIRPTFDWWQGKTAFQWFLRNPVCNLRFTPWVSTRPSPDTQFIGSNQVEPDGTPCHFLAWSGPFVGYRYQNTRWGMWLGWKVNPRDARFVPPDDYRCWGIGTAAQIMRF